MTDTGADSAGDGGDLDEEVTDDDVQRDIAEGLLEFPALRAVLPERFPADKSYEITLARMREYSATRGDKFWHQLNLPLVVNAYRGSADAKVRSLMLSVLRALDQFLGKFGTMPGARSLVSPVWRDLWTETPQLWSVLSCVYMAQRFVSHRIELLGFEQPIGRGGKDADITVRLGGVTTHVEVEAFHRADFSGATDEELIAVLERRADMKAGLKFVELPTDEQGVVSIVAVVRGADAHRALSLPVQQIPGRNPNIKWMVTRLVGLSGPNGLEFGLVP